MELLPQLTLDRSSATPLSEQLASQLRSAILTGTLQSGDRLPASRRLAEQLGASRTVVISAYEQLIGEAFLDSRQGAGTFVSPQLPSGAAHLPAHQPLMQPGVQTDAEHHKNASESALIRLCTGRPHVGSAPPKEWVRALSRAAREPWLAESIDPRGDAALRHILAQHVRLTRGLQCTGDDIVVTSGTAEALLLIGIAIREQHRRLPGAGTPVVAVEHPGYPEGVAALRAAGVDCVAIAVDQDGMSLDQLTTIHRKQPLAAIMLTPSHQFPMGGSLPADARLAILEWARQETVMVIEDDYDSEFRHTGPLLPAIASLDRHGITSYVASLNKILSPSLRCGFLVLPANMPNLRTAMCTAREALGSSLAAPIQVALARFIASGGLKRAVARNRREYRHRRELILDLAATYGIPLLGSEGGLHVVIDLPEYISAEKIAAQLLQHGILLEPLSELGTGGSVRNGLAIGYGHEPIPRLIYALQLLFEELHARVESHSDAP